MQSIKDSPTLLLQQLKNNHFRIISKRNYGKWSMVQKQRYSIKGQLEEAEGRTNIHYNVTSNSTYAILKVILPIMLLPTLIVGMGSKKEVVRYLNLSLYLVMTVSSIDYCWHKERQLKQEGVRDFQKVLEQLDY